MSPVLGSEQSWLRPQVRFVYNSKKEADAIRFLKFVSAQSEFINNSAKLGIVALPRVNIIYFLNGSSYSVEQLFLVVSKKSE